MINFIKNLFKTDFVEWERYKAKVDFLDEFNWQQNIRKHNLKVKK